MADATASNLDDFLGVRPQPAWRGYIKWVLVAIGVVLLVLLEGVVGAEVVGVRPPAQQQHRRRRRGRTYGAARRRGRWPTSGAVGRYRPHSSYR